MRERRQGDWTADLRNRHGVESAVAAALCRHPRLGLVRQSTESFDRLDFQIVGPGGQLGNLEVKAKCQVLSPGWRMLRPDVDERDLFVLDELALRKIVDAGRYTFLLVRDEPSGRWVLWSSGDLTVASRVRHTRRLEKSARPTLKGKLLLDLAEAGYVSPDVDDVFDKLATTLDRLEDWWSDGAPWPTLNGLIG